MKSMQRIRKRLTAGAHIFSRKEVNEDPYHQVMLLRAETAQSMIDIASDVFNHDEMLRLCTLLSDLVLGPLDRVRYKSKLPEQYKEYPFLSKQQIRRRKAKEVSYGVKRKVFPEEVE